MLNYEEFKSEFIQNVKSRLDAGLQLSVTKIRKTNNPVKEAVTFKGECNKVFPVFYIQDCYEQYQENENMEKCIRTVMDLLNTELPFEKEALSIDWADVQSKIRVQLINREWNEEILNDVPFLEMCDLAVVSRIVFQENEEGRASCLIRNQMLEYWGITKNQLWEAAFTNLKNERFWIRNIEDLLADIFPDLGETGERKEDSDMALYVLSNESQIDGAVGLLRTDVIKRLSEKLKTDLYILPSSLHELILLPMSEEMDIEELRQTVMVVNGKCVDPEERLSDKVYCFRRLSGKVEIAA